jgi:hypothetical protein
MSRRNAKHFGGKAKSHFAPAVAAQAAYGWRQQLVTQTRVPTNRCRYPYAGKTGYGYRRRSRQFKTAWMQF